MENGSLGEVLHGEKGGVLLDWPKRFSIAVGTALGLTYIHHDCVQSIIHRDVKSNNILLDDELHHRVADFGLAKTFKCEKDMENTMSQVAGSYNYIAPVEVIPAVHVYLLWMCARDRMSDTWMRAFSNWGEECHLGSRTWSCKVPWLFRFFDGSNKSFMYTSRCFSDLRTGSTN